MPYPRKSPLEPYITPLLVAGLALTLIVILVMTALNGAPSPKVTTGEAVWNA